MVLHETSPIEARGTGYHALYRRHAGALCAAAMMAAIIAIMAEEGARAAPPPAVEITPNAIERHDKPMKIAIRGAKGQKLHLLILQDCNSDWEPEIAPRERCNPRIWTRQINLDQRGEWQLTIKKMQEVVPKELFGQPLWLRVSPNPDGRWPYGDAMFTVVNNPCSLWDTVIGMFGKEKCNADVVSTLRPQMGGNDERPAVALEVLRLVRDAVNGTWARPVPVPGTRGATGVAWPDARNLFVTVGWIEDDVLEAVEEPSRAVQPGLYRIDVASGKRKLLLAAREGEILAAPFAVQPDYMVFVRERVVADRDGTVATLAVWNRGRVIREIPLRRTIHQILAADPKRPSVLAYSRWEGVPALLRVDLRTGAVTHLGFAAQLFHAVMSSPGGNHAVVAVEDNAGYNGWDIILVDGKGQLAEELAVGPGEDLMPAWRPGRPDELAYLGQADGRTEAP